jgi:hypothetical protein
MTEYEFFTGEKPLEGHDAKFVDRDGFTWQWCTLCKAAFVRCGWCGLNTCSCGKNCDMCKYAHKHDHDCYSNHTQPSKIQILGVEYTKEEEKAAQLAADEIGKLIDKFHWSFERHHKSKIFAHFCLSDMREQLERMEREHKDRLDDFRENN